MAGGGSKKKRRRQQKAGKAAKAGGALTGMRSGFKNVTGAVTGTGPPSKRNSIIGTVVTVALVLVAAVVLYQKFR